MRRLPWFVLLLAACRSDPAPAPAASTQGSASSSAFRLDTATLPGAPTVASIGGWWVVETGFVAPNDDPGARPGSAWFFGPDALRLIFGDSHDRRPILKLSTVGDALRVEVEGAPLLVYRRKLGLVLQFEGEAIRVPLRPATPGELEQLKRIDDKRAKMLDRACEKALSCCNAARTKHVAKDNDCQPLMATSDLDTCIAAIALYKRKAAEAKVLIPECLPDK